MYLKMTLNLILLLYLLGVGITAYTTMPSTVIFFSVALGISDHIRGLEFPRPQTRLWG